MNICYSVVEGRYQWFFLVDSYMCEFAHVVPLFQFVASFGYHVLPAAELFPFHKVSLWSAASPYPYSSFNLLAEMWSHKKRDLVLWTGILYCHYTSCRNVSHSHGTLRLVYMLATSSTRSISVYPQIWRSNADLGLWTVQMNFSDSVPPTNKGSTSVGIGKIATVIVEVWVLPIDSVCGTRCTRCTPLSYFSLPNTPSPFILIVASCSCKWD